MSDIIIGVVVDTVTVLEYFIRLKIHSNSDNHVILGSL